MTLRLVIWANSSPFQKCDRATGLAHGWCRVEAVVGALDFARNGLGSFPDSLLCMD